MGQEILNPPTVEGWHTGREWIDTGNLVERVNSAALEMGDVGRPGVQAALQRIRSSGESLAPEAFVDACLDAVGQFEVTDSTRESLVTHARQEGQVEFQGRGPESCAESRVAEMLQLIVATREYQLA